ncbi:hypothetical protein [Alkaliphilus sp. B6464]|uniref:hypothetical protein n=1 Tax=Alkaliphilus sp. B6464 TaxID=2731219 RepID=UPI001BAE4329|nr:hypothetical protein [Alkaliphilus sp. B6464]QUH19189.1 hypothetical protein HYG84_04310 [Alkaliphilus sp. B6464]
MKRRYRRYFVMLEVEDKSSGTVKNEGPKGYAKIEVKNDEGTLAIYCQNLKTGNNGDRYRWYLINTKKEGEPAIVEVGPMEVDEKGKGEVVWEFNAENVRGSMEEIDNFNVLILAVQNKDDKGNLFIPLVGYIDKEKPTAWRYALEKHLYIPSKKEKEIDSKIASPKPQEEPAIPEKLHEHIETDKEYIPIKDDIKEIIDENIEDQIEETQSIKDEVENKSQSVEEQIEGEILKETEEKVVEQNDIFVEEEIERESSEETEEKVIEQNDMFAEEQIERRVLKEIEEEVVEQNNIFVEEEGNTLLEDEINSEESYGVQMQGYIENALKDFPKVNPFVNNLEGYIWWQIPYNHQTIYRSYMPFILYVDSVRGPINYYASKMMQTIYLHQHHIFGILYEENSVAKYYAYGIPGRRLSSEQPYEGATGFTYWHPCDPGPQDINSHGYWILLIDPKNGKVIEN